MFQEQYDGVWEKNPKWNAIETGEGELYEWNDDSTYIQEPPFLATLTKDVAPIEPITGARCLAVLGDSTTTDHISPAGAIAKDSPAGKFLQVELGRRAARLQQLRLAPRQRPRDDPRHVRQHPHPQPAGARHRGRRHAYLPTGEVMPIYDAAMKYQADGTPLVVLAGAEYGTGSSRDWAAKGTYLLGVRAVLAASFERIHRSNLVMMGVLPLEFQDGATRGVARPDRRGDVRHPRPERRPQAAADDHGQGGRQGRSR